MRCRSWAPIARLLILALAAAIASCATHPSTVVVAPVPEVTTATRPLPPLRVFVGRLAAATRLPRYTFSDGSALFDTGWTLRYEVLQAVRGDFHETAMTFDYWGHGGLTEFGRYDTVLVFVFGPDAKTGERVMARYLAFPAVRTLDGRWAVCGEPRRIEGLDPPKRRRLQLDGQLRYNTLVAEEDAFVPEDSHQRPGKRRCLGVLVDELAAYYARDAEPGYMRTW